jgi:hypothetical protein
MRAVGLVATVAVTVYVARLARRAIRERTTIEDAGDGGAEIAPHAATHVQDSRTVKTLVLATAAGSLLFVAVWATANEATLRPLLERHLLPDATESRPRSGAESQPR